MPISLIGKVKARYTPIGYSMTFYGLVALILTMTSCNQPEIHPYHPAFEAMKIPEDNALTEEKIALGKQLFFDKRLSLSKAISCATCHDPQKAFTDGQTKSIGHLGHRALRNAPSLLNIGFQPFFMADGGVPTLEMQALVPLMDTNEMAATGMSAIIRELSNVSTYQIAAKKIYNRPIDAWVVTRSLAAYQRSLVTSGSRLDAYLKGNKKTLNASEIRGWKLFDQELKCTNCHSGIKLTRYTFEKNGLATGKQTDYGRYRIDGIATNKWAFRVPSLRNVTLTGPYMHDGSYKTINEVLNAYEKVSHSGRIGRFQVASFKLNATKRSDLLHFFNALIDTNLVFDF